MAKRKDISIDAWLAEIARLEPNPGESPKKKYLTDEQLEFIKQARDLGHTWDCIHRVLRTKGMDLGLHTMQKRYNEWVSEGG